MNGKVGSELEKQDLTRDMVGNALLELEHIKQSLLSIPFENEYEVNFDEDYESEEDDDE